MAHVTKSSRILFTFLTLSFFTITGWAATPPQETWMNVSLMGEKIGYYHEVKTETTYQGDSAIKMVCEMISKLKRFGLDFDVSQTVTVILGKDLQSKYCNYHEIMMGSEKSIIAKLENGKMVVYTIVGNDTTRMVKDWNSKMQFDAAVPEIILRDGLIAGKKYNFSVFSPELGSSFDVSVSVGSTQRASVEGTWYETVPIKADYTGMQELSTNTYVTKSGLIVKAEVGNYGMTMTRTDEATAKIFGQKMDVADLSRIRSNVSLADPESVTKTRLKITAKEGSLEEIVPTDERQKWDGKTDGKTGIMVIQSPQGPMDFTANWPVPITDSSLSKFTSSTPFIEANDPEIFATAKKVAGTEKNAWKASVKLADWVYNAVENKTFDTGFASAKQTFKDRKGDCTEHSVLLAALTRSLGVPTKIVVGLAAVEDGFYYHMWTEVYVGKWVALDPTFNEPRVDAAHIKLSETKTKEDELGDYAIQLLKSLKKINIEVVEYTENGETIKPDSTPSSGTESEMDIIQKLLTN